MRLILTLLATMASVAAAAETTIGTLYCGEISKSNESVVVYVNGILNNLTTSESSRLALEERIGGVCDGENCSVEKYYNSGNGLGDVFELQMTSEIERVSSYDALFELRSLVELFYPKFREKESALLQKTLGIDASFYDSVDELVLSALRDYGRVGNSDDYWVFQGGRSGTSPTLWLRELLLIRANSTAPEGQAVENSLVLKLLDAHQRYFDARFLAAYRETLVDLYVQGRQYDVASGDLNFAEKIRLSVAKSVDGLVTYLEEHMLGGKRVVVVAHSQGNHIIEIAHAILIEKWGSSARSAIQVVGVAPVSATTPSNTYVSWQADRAVGVSNVLGTPLSGNFNADFRFRQLVPSLRHSFDSVYLSDEISGTLNRNGLRNTESLDTYPDDFALTLGTWTALLIESGLTASVPFNQQIESEGLLTVSLRWEEWSDMDLHVREQSASESFDETVYFDRKQGILGSLDRDDTRDGGPEHYRVRAECSLSESFYWEVGVQQWPSYVSAPVTTHLTVKLGNAYIYDQSYSANPGWPYGVQGLARIWLYPGINQVGFRIEQADVLTDAFAWGGTR